MSCSSIDNCTECEYDSDNKTLTCNTCDTDNKYYVSDGECVSCGDTLTNCSTCEITDGSLTCLECEDDTYYKKDNVCSSCSTFDSNCTNC